MSAPKISVYPANGHGMTAVDYRNGAKFFIHDDGDLTVTRDELMIAAWARGQWQRVEVSK